MSAYKYRLSFRWVLIVFLLQGLYSDQDFESRNTFAFQLRLPNSFRLNCEQSLRLIGNQFSFKQTFTEATLSYRLTKRMKLFLPVRYAIYEDKIKTRFSLGGSIKNKVNFLSLRYRTLYQRTYQESKDTKILSRNKFYLYYVAAKKMEPFIAYEVFYPIENSIQDINEKRYSIGMEIDLTTKRAFKIYYQLKIEGLDKLRKDKTDVLGLSYSMN